MSESGRQNTRPILWDADTDVCLFYALRGYKPVGINKNFHMMGIHRKFAQSLGQNVTSADLWEHLSSMYNLPFLDESENLPFENEIEHFELPEEIFNFGKEPVKTKEADLEEPAPVVKSSVSKKTSQQPAKNTSFSKRGRKRTRSVAAPSPGAAGPGANTRKRH